MANPQLIVLVGVFLVSILLTFLFVTKEGFRRRGGAAPSATIDSLKKSITLNLPIIQNPKAKAPAKNNARKNVETLFNRLNAALSNDPKAQAEAKAVYDKFVADAAATPAAPAAGGRRGRGAAAPAAGGAAAPAAAPAAGGRRGRGAAAAAGAAAPAAGGRRGRGAAAAPAAAAGAVSGASEEGAIRGVPARAGGMKFSELIQSLIAYSPGRGAGGAPVGTALGAPAAAGAGAAAVSAAGGAELINEVRKAVRDEVRQTRDGANTALANRSTNPTGTSTPNVTTPGLSQGAELRNPAMSPYGLGQAGASPVSVVIYPGDFGAQLPATNTVPSVPTANVYGLA